MAAWSVLSIRLTRFSVMVSIELPRKYLAKEYKVTTEESKAVLLEMARISQENYEVLTPFGIDEL